ncbi:MAG: glycosyltransferase family 2 protein [Anaerolineales bacterium]|nr:glycosyltransferase family 2 protein [Anaerolineales bacterium]
MPRVSVVIPTYNRADLILETLDSVFRQSYRDYEIVVVDDGSTDDLKSVLQPYIQNGRIKYVYQENAGLPAARNTGIRHSKGEWIAFLDSDDLFTPDKLKRQIEYLDAHPEAVFLHSFFSKFDNQGNDLGVRDTSFYQGLIYPQMLLEWDVLMASPCVVARRDVFEEAGYFDETLHWAEDLDMWRRVSRIHPFHIIPEPLAKIRVHTSMSSDKTHEAEAFMIYLEKAFAEDPSLSDDLKKKAVANMYINVANNLLGTGGREQIRIARRHCWQAIRREPTSWQAYTAFLLSLIPLSLRKVLIIIYRRMRYRTA